MKIYCCKCGKNRPATLTKGKEIYPHRKDLFKLPFWKCDTCGNHVGCHHKTNDRTKPLRVIPNDEIRAIRKEIHAIIDPLWKEHDLHRGDIYSRLSKELGYTYHTVEIRTVKEGQRILEIVRGFQVSDFKTQSRKLLTTYLMLGQMAMEQGNDN